MIQAGENDMVCDLCGADEEVQCVDMSYAPTDQLTARFTLYICTDCLIEWVGKDL